MRRNTDPAEPPRRAQARLSDIRAALGEPAIELADSALIYRADCLDALPSLRSTVDLTVTSPPYNICKAYEKALPLEK